MPFYLNHKATSALHPQAADAVLPSPRNPAGLHGCGHIAHPAVDAARARARIASRLHRASTDAAITSSRSKPGNGQLNAYPACGDRRAGQGGTTPAKLEMQRRDHYLMGLRVALDMPLASIPGRVTGSGRGPAAANVNSKRNPNVIRVSFARDHNLRNVEAPLAGLQVLVNELPSVMRNTAV